MKRITASVGAWTLVSSLVLAAVDLGSEEEREAGRLLYDKYCSQCHGASGDGVGVATPYLKPRPRDFTRGKYKIRSTPTGTLPTDEDLKAVIRNGMPYSGMPPWPNLSESELTNLVYHLKTFYPGFSDANEAAQPLEIPSVPAYSEESSQRGRAVYEGLGCASCHGDQGRGDGPSAPTLADDWGFHLRPADLTKPWTFRGGATRKDIYRTFMTGLNGTPMPSYGDEGALPVEDRWPLVDYIFSLSGSTDPDYANLLIAVGVPEEIELEQGTVQFDGAPAVRFPIIGQIVEPGRNFYPSTNSVEVRAIYNQDDLAILVQWSDIRADLSGSNSPTMEPPAFDPELEQQLEYIGQPEEEVEDDLWDDDPFAEDITQTPAAAETEEEEEAGDARLEFSDAVAIQFPVQKPDGFSKPYFLFGEPDSPVDLWFLDLAGEKPVIYEARGTESIEASDDGLVEAIGYFESGRWSVIFKRKRNVPGSLSFDVQEFVPVAFSVWDGFNRERGNKRGLSAWFHLYLESVDKPSPVGPMVKNSLAVLVGLVVVVFIMRKTSIAGQSKKNREISA